MRFCSSKAEDVSRGKPSMSFVKSCNGHVNVTPIRILLTNGVHFEINPRTHDLIPPVDASNEPSTAIETACTAEWVREAGCWGEVAFNCRCLEGWRRLGEKRNDCRYLFGWRDFRQ